METDKRKVVLCLDEADSSSKEASLSSKKGRLRAVLMGGSAPKEGRMHGRGWENVYVALFGTGNKVR